MSIADDPEQPRGYLAMNAYARQQAFSDAAVARLRRIADVDIGECITDFDAGGDALAQARFLITGWGCPMLTPEVLDRMPRLELIAHAAGTVKHHVPAEAWRRGIAVSSAADANAEPVAQYTYAMVVLAGKRALSGAGRYAQQGQWPSEDWRGAASLVGKTVGIVGASRIGRRVLRLLEGHGLELLLSDPYCDDAAAAAMGARLVDLDELCRRSDIVSIHAPQLPQTRHLIDARRLDLMVDDAVLINTSRGSLVDTEALTQRCKGGRLDAILDVTDPEPLPAQHPLLRLTNVLVTPHVAGAQGREVMALGEYAVAEVARFYTGEDLGGAVSEADLATMA